MRQGNVGQGKVYGKVRYEKVRYMARYNKGNMVTTYKNETKRVRSKDDVSYNKV